jgi:hypothetical protein
MSLLFFLIWQSSDTSNLFSSRIFIYNTAGPFVLLCRLMNTNISSTESSHPLLASASFNVSLFLFLDLFPFLTRVQRFLSLSDSDIMAPKQVGRPKKYQTDEERKAARAAASRRFYAQRQQESRGHPPAQSSRSLEFRPDPYTILRQAGPEGFGQITNPSLGIQTDGLNVPTDPQPAVLLYGMKPLRS